MKHPHKGRASNRTTKQNIPLIEMSQQERDQVFSDMAASTWRDELSKARRGEQGQIQLAVLYLTHGDREPMRMIMWDIEYGDGQGVLFILHIIKEIRLQPDLLLPGESLQLRILEPTRFRHVDFSQAQADAIAEDAPAPQPGDGAGGLSNAK